MATTYESAKNWIDTQQPSNEDIEQALNKLEQRIDSFKGDASAIQGSIDAADYLTNYLAKKTETHTPANNSEPNVTFDASPLVPDAHPRQLQDSVKKETFAALKEQFGKTIK